MAAEGDAAQGEADMEEGGPPAADSRALARAMAEGATAMVAEAWVMVEREGAATARVAAEARVTVEREGAGAAMMAARGLESNSQRRSSSGSSRQPQLGSRSRGPRPRAVCCIPLHRTFRMRPRNTRHRGSWCRCPPRTRSGLAGPKGLAWRSSRGLQ